MKNENSDWSSLKNNLGIDFQKYHDKDIVGSLEGLKRTPINLIFQFIFWPILFALLILATGIFFIWPQSWLGGFFWILVGLSAGPLAGISVASYLVVAALEQSSKSLYEAILDTLTDISVDIKQNADNQQLNQALPTYKELLRLVKLSLVIPALKELLVKKLWPFGNWIGNIVVNYLKKLSQKSEYLLSNEDDLKANDPERLNKYADAIEENTQKLRKNLNTAHIEAIKVTVAPLKFNILMSLTLNAILLTLIWYLFIL